MLDDRHGSQSPAPLPHPIAVLLVALLAAIFSPSAWAQPWAKSPRGAAPTFPHASQTLAAVQQQIARLKAAGDEEAARQIAQAIEIIKSQMTGDYAPTSSDEPEVHGVSLQEGAPPPPGLITGKHRFTTGYAEVQITHTARPILLVLQGSRAIHWNVKPAKGVKFAAVLLSGGEQQTVAGLPPKTLIVDHSAGRATGEGVPSISDSAEARSVLDSWALDQLGFPIATALSASQYTGAPIVIGPENSDWRDRQLARQAESLLAQAQATTQKRQQARVQKLRFKSVYYVPFSRARAGHEGPAPGGVGEFTVAGPIQSTLRPIKTNVRFPVTVEIGGETHRFAVSEHGELVTINEDWEGAAPKVPQDATLNPSGRVSNLTLDAKRKRLVCANRDNRQSKLLAYDLATNQWSALAAPKHQIKGLTYVAEQDLFYAIAPNADDHGQPQTGSTLYIYDGAGKEVRRQSLELTMLRDAMAGRGTPSAHLALTDGLLIIHSPPTLADSQGLAGRIDVVDPTSGDVLYSGAPTLHDGAAPAEKLKPLPRVTGRLGKALRLVSQVESTIATLRRRGETALADDCANQLAVLRDQLYGGVELASTDPEFYVVGVYSSPDVIVEVTQTARPVVLLCSACESTHWSIRAAPGVRLSRIIVAGGSRQTVGEAPREVPLAMFPGEDGTGGFYIYDPTGSEGSGFSNLKRLKELIDLPIATFQTAPRQSGSTITVGPTDADWRFQRVLPKLESLLAMADRKDRAARLDLLSKLKFTAVHRTKNARGDVTTAAMADFTVHGPIVYSLTPLPKSYAHLAYDPRDNRFFAIESHSVVEIDPTTGAQTELPVRGRLPELSWPCGLAFDTRRRRVMLTSLGGEGFLYAYDLARKEWSVLTSMKNKDMIGMTYDEENDVLYGMFEEYGAGHRLQTMTPEGAVLRWPRIDLADLGDSGRSRPFGPGVQLASAGGYLIVIRSEWLDEAGRPAKPGLIRLYDPRTGESVYQGDLKAHPGYEQLSARQIEQFWETMAGPNAKLADKAAWQLAAGRDDAVRFVAAELQKARPNVDADAVKQLVKELDAEKFAQREAAQRKLTEMGPAIEDELHKYAENQSAEVRQRVGTLIKRLQETQPTEPALRRTLLAVEVLKRAGTDEAKTVLKKLAAGSSTRQLARAATDALKRIESGE